MELPINYKESHFSVRKQAREEYVRIQDGKCCYCGSDLIGEPSDDVMAKKINKNLFPKNIFDYAVHLHHCHKTGMTIGAVHSKCNAVLWQFHGE